MSQPVSIPLTDAVLVAVARLVDDSQEESHREPSHSALEHQIDRAGLAAADPNRTRPDRPLGKEKRIRHVLSWAMEHDPGAGEALVGRLLAQIRGLGGFRDSSPNFVGSEPIQNLASVLRAEGVVLENDGEVRPLLLDSLVGVEMTSALEAYVRRAKRGAQDAALVTGTGKDLLEATAAHVLSELYGQYPTTANFPTLLGQAFTALELATAPPSGAQPVETAQQQMERCLYELACAVNRLRNREGTGHGRPFLPTVTTDEARTAIEAMGIIAERLLLALKTAR